MVNTYRMKGFCNNCGLSGEIDVPKGQKTHTFEKIAECKQCGVKGEITIEKPIDKYVKEKIGKDWSKYIRPTPQPLPLPYRRYEWEAPNPYNPYPYWYAYSSNVTTRDDLKNVKASLRTPEDQAKLNEDFYNK